MNLSTELLEVPPVAIIEEEVPSINDKEEAVSLDADVPTGAKDDEVVVKAEKEELAVPYSSTATDSSNSTRNTMTVTTTLPPLPSPPPPVETMQLPTEDEPVHYVDERSKAMGRKAELEALRSLNGLTKKKGASSQVNCIPTHFRRCILYTFKLTSRIYNV